MTTNAIPLDQLPPRPSISRLDGYNRYLIVPPGGGKPVGHTRVTTVAATLDSGGGLAPWKSTMTAVGLVMRRGLAASWEALVAEHDGNPWYGSKAGKAACKKLVEECANMGGANDRRDLGTALHALTALLDQGRAPRHVSEATEADLHAYVTGLDNAGIELIPGAIELTVVLDAWQVAGTLDRLVRVPGFDLPLIADLKTGADLTYSWESIAVQLAAYSRADRIYVQGDADDGSQDYSTPMPEVDQNHGLILWLDAGAAQLELFVVRLDLGWEAFEISMQVRAWRNRTLSTPLREFDALRDDALLAQLEASVAMVEERKAATPVVAPAESYKAPVAPQPVIDVEQPSYTQQLRDWLQRRIDVIGLHADTRTDLGQNWPAGLPTLNGSQEHTPDQLAAIEQLLDGVETRHSIPFGDSKPTTDQLGVILHLFPNSTVVNDQTGSTS